MDERVRALLDRDEIRRVVMDFARAVDHRDWELLRSCFHPGARDDHGVFAGDAEDYVDWVAENLPQFAERTMHFIGNVIIDLDGETVATAESYVIGYHRYSREDGTRADWIAAGRYLDRFEKRGGAWRIADRRLLWEWVRDDPVGGEFESFGIDPALLAWGGMGRDG